MTDPILGWDSFCRKCGNPIARGKLYCRQCSHENAIKGRFWGVALVALTLILASLPALNATEQCTREKVIWLLQSGTYGPIAWDTPNVVDWYYNKICANPQVADNSLKYVPKAMNRTETKQINATHQLNIVYIWNKNAYNTTSLIPIIPELDPSTPTGMTNAALLNPCANSTISAFKYALMSHKSWYHYYALNTSVNHTTDIIEVNSLGHDGFYDMKEAGVPEHGTTIAEQQAYERFWTLRYTEYLVACHAISLNNYADIIKEVS